ncbi:MAG: valine--tRNA ligase [Candidatus Micrarchaeia archaeon]|jgi:valyl-tRNA synthetase
MLGQLDCRALEEKWASKWEQLKLYAFDESDAKKPIFSIDTPPPFPTGEFHTGSTLNWCYIDFVARFRRMRGFNVFFPQGWDCHGFPTEVKVEKKYGKLPREEFRKRCLEWSHEMVASIKTQMKQMGFSIDWSREYYTLNKEYYSAVQYSLIEMFRKNQVYHQKHPVLWCPSCESAIAKAETEEVERETLLNFLKFKCSAAPSGVLLIATTRPELLHACVAVLVHPEDERFKALVGGKCVTPLFGKEVPILADPDVDSSFGTGAVMVCTFGDKTDVVWAYRHKLPIIDFMDERGLLVNAGAYDGMPLAKARAKILEDLQAAGLLEKQEKLKQTIKIHDRCKKPIELLNSLQWFIRLKGFEETVKKAAHSMRWVPDRARQLLMDWVNGLEWDWCISRQRVFGIPIPFWYCEKCGEVYAPKESQLPVDPTKDEPPVKKCRCGGALKGETSICDGWVDSSITPLFVAGWPENKELMQKIYPSSLRPQGTDIIRTWAFYTIHRCTLLTGVPPFKEVLVNGMVCGEDGKKMSKSLGNYVEAKDVIARTSVDALRQWAALSGSTGNDNSFFWKDVNYAQSFLNKYWNACKFVEKALEGFDEKQAKSAPLRLTDRWILSRLNETIGKCTKFMEDYDFYSAITLLHSFFWHEFCDFYLEDVKHRIYVSRDGREPDAKSKLAAQRCLYEVTLKTTKMLAPFAAFTAEEVYQQLFAARDGARSVHLTDWPVAEEEYLNKNAENIVGVLHSLLSKIRKFKASNSLALNEELSSATVSASELLLKELEEVEEELRVVGKLKNVEFKLKEEGEVDLTVSV